MKAPYYQQLRLGELPKGVYMTHEGERFYVETPQLGRVPMTHGDWVVYDNDRDWNTIGVVRSAVMEQARQVVK